MILTQTLITGTQFGNYWWDSKDGVITYHPTVGSKYYNVATLSARKNNLDEAMKTVAKCIIKNPKLRETWDIGIDIFAGVNRDHH
jgi:hypothetical protein